jgi:hypothetical protein
MDGVGDEFGAVARLRNIKMYTPRGEHSDEKLVPPESWPQRASIELDHVVADYV